MTTPQRTEAGTALVDDTDPPLSTAPTPENLQTLVFERAFSECASYDIARLAGKYNVAVQTEENVAKAVAEAWARQFTPARTRWPTAATAACRASAAGRPTTLTESAAPRRTRVPGGACYSSRARA